MTFRAVLLALAAAGFLANASAWAAPAGEPWSAYSKTAIAVTGNITFSPDRITFGNGGALPLAPAGAAPDFVTVWGKRNASLFRVTAPDDPILLNGKRLCGRSAPQPVTFIVISRPPPAVANLEIRAMDVFSGAEPPKGVDDPHYCGNYNFELTLKHDWNTAVSNDGTRVNIHSKALDGKTMFYGACNTRLGRGLGGSIENYNGNALERVEDVDRKIVFTVTLPDGNREFPAMAHYYGPDKAWVLSDPPLPVAFMDALGRGDLLTVRNARRDRVAEFDLKGAAKAIEIMRRVCR
jgi:hypothetical protein